MTGGPRTELTSAESRALGAAIRRRDEAEAAYQAVLSELARIGKAGAVARQVGITR